MCICCIHARLTWTKAGGVEDNGPDGGGEWDDLHSDDVHFEVNGHACIMDDAVQSYISSLDEGLKMRRVDGKDCVHSRAQ